MPSTAVPELSTALSTPSPARALKLESQLVTPGLDTLGTVARQDGDTLPVAPADSPEPQPRLVPSYDLPSLVATETQST